MLVRFVGPPGRIQRRFAVSRSTQRRIENVKRRIVYAAGRTAVATRPRRASFERSSGLLSDGLGRAHGSQPGRYDMVGEPGPAPDRRQIGAARGNMQRPILIVLKNIGSLTLGSLFGRLLNFVVVAIMVRTAGTEGLGGYATATAVAGYFVILSDVGLSGRLVRESAACPDSASDEYSRSLGIKLVTTFVCAVLLAVLAFTLPYESWVLDLLVLLSVANVVRSFSQINHSIFRARELMELEALSTFVHAVVFGSAVTVLLLDLPIVFVGWSAIAAAVVQLILTSVIVTRFVPLRITIPPDWATTRDTAPYTAASAAEIAFLQSDVVVLSFIASQSLIGEFASITRLLFLAAVVPMFLNLAIVPVWSRIFGRDEVERFRRLTTASLQTLTILAGAGVVSLTAVSKILLRLVYGEGFEELSNLLVLGSLYLLFNFVNSGVSVPLVSAGRQAIRAKAMLIGIFVKVGLVFFLVPSLGVAGALLALVLAEVALMAVQLYRLSDVITAFPLAKTWAWVVGGIVPSFLLYAVLTARGDDWLAALLPILLYTGVVFASRDVPKLVAVVREFR